MSRDRSPVGFLASSLGSVLLGLAVFLPWYGVSFTAQGVAFFEHTESEAASRFGNGVVQQSLAGLHGELSSLVGRQVGTVSAHQVLTTISPILLILAGLGIVIALVSAARGEAGDFDGTGSWMAVLGAIAMLFVLYRMLVRPIGNEDLDLTLQPGAWLALLGCLGMIVGGLWPRRLKAAQPASPEPLEGVFSGLSGWTPEP